MAPAYLISCHQFHLFRHGPEFTKKCELPSQSLGPQGAAARLDANLWWLRCQHHSPKCAWNGVRGTAREAGPHFSGRLPPLSPASLSGIQTSQGLNNKRKKTTSPNSQLRTMQARTVLRFLSSPSIVLLSTAPFTPGPTPPEPLCLCVMSRRRGPLCVKLLSRLLL